jgi:aldehyde dehydrogenase (NAD+)
MTMEFKFSKTNLPKQLFINNEYVDAKNSKKLSLYNPKDGSLVADDVALAGAEDVDAAVAAGEKAFPAWKRIPPTQRRDIIMKFALLIEQYQKELSELTRITLGAPYGSFGKFEIGLTAEVHAPFTSIVPSTPIILARTECNLYRPVFQI